MNNIKKCHIFIVIIVNNTGQTFLIRNWYIFYLGKRVQLVEISMILLILFIKTISKIIIIIIIIINIIIIIIYYILSSNKGIFVWSIWPEVNCPYFHTPWK
jgi:hypothetical protein